MPDNGKTDSEGGKRMKISVNTLQKSEQLELCRLLVSAGYTVTLTKEKQPNKRSSKSVIIYNVSHEESEERYGA